MKPEKARWTLLRAGLQNIWEYDSQVFVCHKGRLLLRGRNESGKTKALEVLLPFLLDGDFSPHRIDPFGSSARQMRFNLIHEGNPDVGVSIGYVWMEFGRRKGDVEEYFTIGAGLKAMKSNSDVTSWYFATSQRVGVDFNLLADTREPLTRKGLEEALKGQGSVWERRADYRHAVRKTLFGLPDDQYSALVDTLIRLRRPQLSNKLDLPELSELLTASLPPLDEAVIRPIAEGFERLDLHRTERDGAARNLKAVQGFEKVYRDYLRSEAKRFAQALTTAESVYHKAREALKEALGRCDAIESERETLGRQLRDFERTEVELGGRLDALRTSEGYKAAEELDRAESQVEAQKERERRASKGETDERASLESRDRRCRDAREALARRKEEAERSRTTAREAARRADLESEHGVIEARSSKGAVEAIASARLEDVAVVERESAKLVQAENEARVRREVLAQAESELTRALARADVARKSEAGVRAACAEKIAAWSAAARVLGPVAELEAALAQGELEKIPALVQAAASARREEFGRRLEEAAAALKAAREEVDRLQAELDKLARETHRHPLAPHWRPAREEGRPGSPFYMLCEFATDDATIQAGLEAALESSGILDAWVTPEGTALDARTRDVLLVAHPVKGRTLLDFLKPSDSRVERILRTIRVVPSGEAGEGTCWVSADGRWGNGALRGAWEKSAAAYIGEAARERERRRRRAELEALLLVKESERAAATSCRDAIRGEGAALDQELRALPSLAAVERALQARIVAEEEVGRKQAAKEEETRGAAAVEKKVSDARTRRDAEAVGRRLTAWVDRLPELRGWVFGYREAAREALRTSEAELASRAALDREESDRQDCARKHAERVEELRAATLELERLRAWAKGLRETAGATREAVVKEARELSERIRTARDGAARVRE
jgi:uncharacterized protein (TIGR02680 family)